MPPTSIQERRDELCRSQSVRRLPISLMMVAAWLVLIALRRVADHFGLLRHVWHPALFMFAVYMTVLSSIVLIVAR
jgi:protein AaeX